MLSGLLFVAGCGRKQEFSFQPRPGLAMRCMIKGPGKTTLDGKAAVVLNFDLEFNKQSGGPVYFLFDSLQVSCNNVVSVKTSCRTASVGVVSQREEVPNGTCLYPLFVVFPANAQLNPLETFGLVRDGLFNEQYEKFIRKQN
jgi:hypothetical protein